MRISKEELKQAFEEVREEKLDQIQEKYEKEEELNRKIETSMANMDWEKLYRQGAKSHNSLNGTKTKKREYGNKWRRGAAVAILILAMGSVTAYAVVKLSGAGVKWGKMLGEKEDDFQFEAVNPVETKQPAEEPGVPERIERRYHPTYVIKGFQKYGEDRKDVSYRIVYKKKKERFYFEQMTKTEKNLSVSSFNVLKNITVNGYDGQMGHRNEEKVLRFTTSQYTFRLWTKADVEWDEMLHMAESVVAMAPDKIETYYEPTYIPNGYSEWKDGCVKESLGFQMYYAKSEEQFIIYSQSTLGGTISIDSEGAKRKKITINGWKGQLNYKKGKQTIIWATNEYSFVLTGVGVISEEELLRVARSVSENGKKDILQKN